VPHPVTVTEKCVSVAGLRPVPVMLAAPIPALPGRGAFRRFSAEPKYDGYRVLLLRYDGRCVVQSRRGTDLSGSFPDLVTAAVGQVPDETILDGEVVVGIDGRLEFAELQKRIASPVRAVALARERPATFLAFDLLVLNERDLRALPLSGRRTELTELMAACRPPLQQVPFTLDHDQAAQWLEDYAAAHIGVEGLILKRVDERTPLLLLSYVAAAAEENFDNMTRRWAYQPHVTARWLTLLESFGYPLTDIETTVRNEAAASLNESDSEEATSAGAEEAGDGPPVKLVVAGETDAQEEAAGTVGEIA
jgi:hypothetical protein